MRTSQGVYRHLAELLLLWSLLLLLVFPKATDCFVPWHHQHHNNNHNRAYQSNNHKPNIISFRRTALPVESSSSIPSSVMLAGNGNNKGDHVETLWTYVRSLQRVMTMSKGGGGEFSEYYHYSTKPAMSLAHFLNSNQLIIVVDDENGSNHNNNQAAIIEPLSRATVQAMRLAALAGNYKLILRLLQGVEHYVGGGGGGTDSSSKTNNNMLMEPRIVGEAIRALHLAKASVSKIKHVWNSYDSHDDDDDDKGKSSLLVRPLGAVEVNAMLQVLKSQGKVKAVVDLYHHHHHRQQNQTDAFSVSIVLSALKDSIRDDQPMAHPNNKNKNMDDNRHDNDDNILLNEFSHWGTPCWQWNTAVNLVIAKRALPAGHVNHVVLANLLQLNARANQAVTGHHGPVMAVNIWKMMQDYNLTPDALAATMLLRGLGREYKAASSIIDTLMSIDDNENHEKESSIIRAPAFAAAVAAFVRARRYQAALDLLSKNRAKENARGTAPTSTEDYNCFLFALTGGSGGNGNNEQIMTGKRRRSDRVDSALAEAMIDRTLQLLAELRRGPGPDTKSYHGALRAVTQYGKSLRESDWNAIAERHSTYFSTSENYVYSVDDLVGGLLYEMEANNIARDSDTYCFAIESVGVRDVAAVRNLLERASCDAHVELSEQARVFNSALGVMADASYLKSTIEVLSEMSNRGIDPSRETFGAVIIALGKGQFPEFIPRLFDAGQVTGVSLHLPGKLGAIELKGFPEPSPELYSLAISTCLIADDYKSAKSILTLMRENDISPSNTAMASITKAYTQSVLCKSRKASTEDEIVKSSRSKAISAYSLARSIESPSISVLASVTKACAHAECFDLSASALRTIHRRVVASADLIGTKNSLCDVANSGAQVLPSLHRSVLRSSAKAGNVTAALQFASLVQDIRQTLVPVSDESSCSESNSSLLLTSDGDTIGMAAPEWVSVLIAASKSGHWKACLSTLQFLQPYLDSLHPSRASSTREAALMEEDYKKISHALSWASKCLAVRSQYGWAVRVLEDWMDWSGRRPPIDAVTSAARVLSKRGRGDEVNSLLAKCLLCHMDGLQSRAYGVSIFVQSISSLHKEGLYDAADDAYISAVSNGILPLQLRREENKGRSEVTLDLHSMNLAVAHSAVRVALQQEILAASWSTNSTGRNDLVIITGRGRGSSLSMRPVLRPEVQRMLVEEFYPPIATSSVPGNIGALRIPAHNVEAWLAHQRVQTGARMLAVASILKGLSSGNRLRAALEQSKTKQSNDNDI